MVRRYFIATFCLISLTMAAVVIQSCLPDCDPAPQTYELTKIDAEAHRIMGTVVVSTSEYFTTEPLAAGKSVRYDSLGFDMRHVLQRVAMSATRGEIISSASACDPQVTYDDVAVIKITSSNAWNDSFPPGTDLTPIMTIHPDFTATDYQVSEFEDAGVVSPVPLLFRFSEAPSADRAHTFIILYTMNDGSTFNTQVENVFVKK